MMIISKACCFFRFLAIRVGQPRLEEGASCGRLTPMACRLRDITYGAPIFVDVDLMKGQQVIRRKNVEIGRFAYAFLCYDFFCEI